MRAILFGIGVVNKPYIVRINIFASRASLNMSRNIHIVRLYRKQINKEDLRKMWEIVACGAWLSFTGYILWFTFGAKKFQPMTLEDLALIWRIHKHQNGCRASQIHDLLVKEDEVVGFNCDCGYQYLQKRLITQKIHPHAQNSKPLLVPELEISPQQIICLRQDLRLRYLNIKRI